MKIKHISIDKWKVFRYFGYDKDHIRVYHNHNLIAAFNAEKACTDEQVKAGIATFLGLTDSKIQVVNTVRQSNNNKGRF